MYLPCTRQNGCMLCWWVRAGVAGLLGAAFNSMRMWLWRVRASKTRHILRIGEVSPSQQLEPSSCAVVGK